MRWTGWNLHIICQFIFHATLYPHSISSYSLVYIYGFVQTWPYPKKIMNCIVAELNIYQMEIEWMLLLYVINSVPLVGFINNSSKECTLHLCLCSICSLACILLREGVDKEVSSLVLLKNCRCNTICCNLHMSFVAFFLLC